MAEGRSISVYRPPLSVTHKEIDGVRRRSRGRSVSLNLDTTRIDSSLYDSFELRSLSNQINRAILKAQSPASATNKAHLLYDGGRSHSMPHVLNKQSVPPLSHNKLRRHSSQVVGTLSPIRDEFYDDVLGDCDSFTGAFYKVEDAESACSVMSSAAYNGKSGKMSFAAVKKMLPSFGFLHKKTKEKKVQNPNEGKAKGYVGGVSMGVADAYMELKKKKNVVMELKKKNNVISTDIGKTSSDSCHPSPQCRRRGCFRRTLRDLLYGEPLMCR